MSTTLSITSRLPLHNSKHSIPQLGFGVYLSPPTTCVTSCATALSAGYRHIDTAQYYDNEDSVGTALRESRIPRSDVYLTSKLLFPGETFDATYATIEASVEKLVGKDGYVDLFLIHAVHEKKEMRRMMWLVLEKAKEKGLVRDIGVSNHGVEQIEEIKTFGKVWPPAVNQIELHPWCQQRACTTYCRKNDILISAYCPLVRNAKATDPTLLQIAEKHGVTTNQVLVRWSLQKGYVPLPKSDTAERIRMNADVFGFVLDEGDMQVLDGCDLGKEGAIVRAVC